MLKRTNPHMSIRHGAAVLLIAALFFQIITLASCSGGSGGRREPDLQFDDSARTEVLTNVFSPKSIGLPEGYEVQERVKPYSDENGIRVLVSKMTETGESTADGKKIYDFGYAILLISADGAVISETAVDYSIGGSVGCGCVTSDGVSFISQKYNSENGLTEYYLCTYRDSGESDCSAELYELLGGSSRFYINSMAVDSAGYVYINTGERIVVLNGSMEEEFDLRYDGGVKGLQTSADGSTVYAVTLSASIVRIDRESRNFAEETRLDNNPAGVYFSLDRNDAQNGGFDFYYSTDEGIFGGSFAAEDESAEQPELVMSFPNSDLVSDNLTVMAVISRDSVLAFDSNRQLGYELFGIYGRSADVDLSQVKVIEYAFPYADFDTYKKAAAYNKLQNGVRIVVKDYSKYYTKEEPDISDRMLAEDIATGRYCPDIVTTLKPTDMCVEQLRRHSLYVDLYELIEQSGSFGRDDIFGCVRRSFEDENGALWAIGRTIEVRTILGNGTFAGEYEGGWTVADMLSLMESLTDGVSLFDAACVSGKAANYVFGSRGFSDFVDVGRGSCDFGGAAFESYLKLAASMPESYTYSKDSSEQLTDSRVNGRVALYNRTYRDISDFLADEAVFNTTDYVRLGYPGTDRKESSAQIDMRPFIITTECRYPAEAWDFIEYLLGVSELADSGGSYSIMTVSSYSSGYRDGLFALKPKFDERMESVRGESYVIGMNGRISTETEDSQSPSPIPEPRITRQLTDELVSAVRDWLDLEAGEPVPESLGDRITEIVNEEASAYIVGAKNAADCADVVGSRVQILLDERG